MATYAQHSALLLTALLLILMGPVQKQCTMQGAVWDAEMMGFEAGLTEVASRGQDP